MVAVAGRAASSWSVLIPTVQTLQKTVDFLRVALFTRKSWTSFLRAPCTGDTSRDVHATVNVGFWANFRLFSS